MSTPTDTRQASDLLLKVTPPRAPKHLLPRPGLEFRHFASSPLVLVQAPPGFGKTSLLAQWRREHLARGAVVAWLSAQPDDDPPRFVQSLALAVRVASGRPTFGHVLLDAVPEDGLEAVTHWLAEVTQSALAVVLVVDEADRLPADSRKSLAYLLHNSPANLQCVVATRADCKLELDDLVAYGFCTVVGAAQLRFRLEETLALVQARFGDAVTRDDAARVHEAAEGWPLGLQLAFAVMGSGQGPAAISGLSVQGGALQEQFVGFMLRNLDAADHDFLTRMAVVAHLHPDMAQALTQDAQAPQRLARLVRETPVFVAGEQTEWVRMHALAREALLKRFHALPQDERLALHARAADWLAAHDMTELAAQHALAARDDHRAYELAERSLYESTMRRGRQAVMLDWLAHLPAHELDIRPRLMLAAAWALATSERHVEAGRYVDRILARGNADDGLRCECALILGGAAIFADDPDAFARLHDPWSESPPLKDPTLLQSHANRTAFRALLDGDPALARLRLQQAPRGHAPAAVYLDRWGDFINSLSYVWEGQVVLAEQLIRPALAASEADLGRRNAFTSMLAALLAAAVWEQDAPDDAAALLANRLDVIERSALPEAVLLAYRTMSRMASAAGAQPRALELMGAMGAVGVARGWPRLLIASVAEQVRMHARHFRAATCRDLCAQLDTLVATHAATRGPLWQRSVEALQWAAHAYAAIAAQDWRGALEPLGRADAVAQQVRQQRLHIELLGLRAWALDRCGERAQPLLQEALGLAQSHGLKRVFADAHPELGAWAREVAGSATPPSRARPPAPLPAAQRATPSMALTPKEREVLELLARNLSNKEIGLAMQVGEETIKWHMKNLFAKLDAGTRKQVVARARILGILADG